MWGNEIRNEDKVFKSFIAAEGQAANKLLTNLCDNLPPGALEPITAR
jgi:hypothetical protein